METGLDGSDGANLNSNPALSTKTGEGELSVAQKKSSMQALGAGKNGPNINVDEQIETGTTNI